MYAKVFLSGEYVTPPEALGAAPWQFTSAQRRYGRFRYLIILQLAPGLANAQTIALLRSMRQNTVLDGLQKGRHYQWAGISVIGFRSKSSAALYRLFIC